MARIDQSSDVWKSSAVDWILKTTKCWTASWCLANIGGITNDWSVSAISGCWITDIVCAIVVIIALVCNLATIHRIANVSAADIVFATGDLSKLANRLSVLKNTFSCCAFVGCSTVDVGCDTSWRSVCVHTDTILARIGWWRTEERVILAFWSWVSV